MLYIICGLPGTGKTTVAKELSTITKGIVLRTDVLRKWIFTNPQYTPEEKQRVYDALFKTAESMLNAGATVILDATFYKKNQREDVKKIAQKAGKKFVIIEVKCDEKRVFKRLSKRRRGASDADFEVYKKIKSEWEPLKEKHFIIDSASKDWRKRLKEILGNK